MKILYQIGPKVSNEVYNEALDMRPVYVLVCHDQNSPISKTGQTFVFVLWVKSYDFENILNLFIVD